MAQLSTAQQFGKSITERRTFISIHKPVYIAAKKITKSNLTMEDTQLIPEL